MPAQLRKLLLMTNKLKRLLKVRNIIIDLYRVVYICIVTDPLLWIIPITSY